MLVETLLAVGRLLARNVSSLDATLRLAVEKPSAYLAKHPETRARFVPPRAPETDPALPWLALVDGLLARHVATELDHRTHGAEARDSLERLSGWPRLSKRTRAWIGTVGREGERTVDCLRRIATRAAADHVVVAVIDIDSDWYVTLLLPEKDYAPARSLASSSGFVLRGIREFDPNA